MERPTVQDVADHAGVSIATVDRVLNARGGVTEKSRAKVRSSVEALGYERDAAATALSTGRSDRFVFVLPEGPNAFLGALRTAIAAERPAARRFRQSLEVLDVPAFSSESLGAALDALDPGSVTGIAVFGAEGIESARALVGLRAAGVRVVTLVSDLPAEQRDAYVGIDNVAAGRTAARFLGRFLDAAPADVMVILGSAIARDHVDRRLGFDMVMRADFPHLTVGASAEGRDDADLVEAIVRGALTGRRPPAAIYAAAAGTRGLVAALKGLRSRPVTVVHELTPHSRRALEDGLIDLVIDQNPAQEVRMAIGALAALREGRAPPAAPLTLDIYVRDNLPARAA
ncbi:LacI family transcriptional regulator [Hasllibacter halocynthiae]|uniref:LacI family transcriptional regulator n=1 Tax=Hasllibacter halocynthiae TaxID=595589 RepID=A0A2T0X7B5_9RHOB|nr:LacI family DNA-binding transcriptional regulator [Hasllibacter halocynthiae]PRY94838.1 LacI family transcriptional regulator [Hasllibacter halocynthiae]